MQSRKDGMLSRAYEGLGHAYATSFYFYTVITVITSFDWSLMVIESVGGSKDCHMIIQKCSWTD